MQINSVQALTCIAHLMEISAIDCWKRFGKEWVFRGFTYTFEQGKSYAVTGNNGSGKSTLLKALAATMPLNKGEITFKDAGLPIPAEAIYREMTFVGPYTELVEELTLKELVDFYGRFKKLELNYKALQDTLQLPGKIQRKPIRFFSSGMKQKVKLGLSFSSASPIIFLDEPTSNFDKLNTEWYLEQLEKIRERKLLIISSNQPYEYSFCDEQVAMDQYKRRNTQETDRAN